MDGFLSPELRGDFNSGILDLHSIDDTEFFPEIAMPEPFQSSPFVPVIEKGFESDVLSTSLKSRMQGGLSGSSPLRSVSNERDKTTSNNSLARIRVVVRKRPLNKKERSRKEEDIITINDLESLYTTHCRMPVMEHLNSIHKVAVLCPNDCLHVAQHVLQLHFQYYPALPSNVQKIMAFVDLAPFFRKQGSEILQKQMHLITGDLMEVLDRANGFQYLEQRKNYDTCSNAIGQVWDHCLHSGCCILLRSADFFIYREQCK